MLTGALRAIMVGTAAAVSLTGCGSVDGTQTATADETADGGTYYFDQVRRIRDEVAPGSVMFGEPESLREALPCSIQTGFASPATAVVSGRIASVEPGDAKIWGSDEGDLTYADDFYDAKVNERNVVVTVSITDGVTDKGSALGDTVRFRVGVAGGSDPKRYISSLESMGDVIVLLSTYPDGRHAGEYYPSLGGAGIGLVDTTSAAVTFPAYGTAADGTDFVGPLDTLSSVLKVCGL